MLQLAQIQSCVRHACAPVYCHVFHCDSNNACRLRIMMKMHGLGDFAYYSVQYVWYMCLYILYITILLAIGSAVNIGFFRDNGYGLQIVRSSLSIPV